MSQELKDVATKKSKENEKITPTEERERGREAEISGTMVLESDNQVWPRRR